MQRSRSESTGGFLALLNQGAAFAPAIPMPKIGAPPPREIRLFKWGKNDTTKGVLFLDQSGAQMAMADFATKGNVGTFDLWHSMFDPAVKPADKETVGNYRLELRGTEKSGEGGLYAVDCQFVPEIAAAITAGKWPFTSPAVAHTKAGKIVGVRNVALVGIPATHDAQPLLLSLLSLPSTSKKANTMKNLRTLYSTGQRMMRDLKQLADSGEQATREFANTFLSDLGPRVAAVGQMLGEAMPTEEAMLAELSAADGNAELLTTLAAKFGTSDPEIIEGKVEGLSIRASAAGTASAKKEADQKEVVRLLSLPENSARIPAADLARMKAKPLAVVTSLLADLKDTPALPGLVHEKEPEHATAKTIGAKQPAKADENKLLTLSDLKPYEQGALDQLLLTRKEGDGAAFNAEAVTVSYLATLTAAKKGA